MYGLRLSKGEPARFVSNERAHAAVQRICFAATRGCVARVSGVYKFGCLQGYRIRITDGDQSHEVTEQDVERFGL